MVDLVTHLASEQILLFALPARLSCARSFSVAIVYGRDGAGRTRSRSCCCARSATAPSSSAQLFEFCAKAGGVARVVRPAGLCIVFGERILIPGTKTTSVESLKLALPVVGAAQSVLGPRTWT